MSSVKLSLPQQIEFPHVSPSKCPSWELLVSASPVGAPQNLDITHRSLDSFKPLQLAWIQVRLQLCKVWQSFRRPVEMFFGTTGLASKYTMPMGKRKPWFWLWQILLKMLEEVGNHFSAKPFGENDTCMRFSRSSLACTGTSQICNFPGLVLFPKGIGSN